MVADVPRSGPGGWLILELSFGSLDHVERCLAGWDELHIEPDLASIPRVIVARSRS
jgi:hypothetical protein